MATTADLIESTRRHLFTGQAEELNRLASGITADGTSLTFTYDLKGIAAGTILQVGLEEIFVFAANAASKQATDCIRGYNGTTATTHTAGAVVTVSPKFSSFRILEALNADLADLSAPMNGLFQVKTSTITFNAARSGYDFTANNVLDILDVRYRMVGPARTWPRITNYAFLRNMPMGVSDDFPTGKALVIYDGAFPGQPIHVRYSAPFATLTALANDVETVAGLPPTMHDIPPLGAAIRLVASREIKRNFDEHQGEPRRADEVPPAANAQAINGLVRLRQSRIQAEQSRLVKEWSFGLVGV